LRDSGFAVVVLEARPDAGRTQDARTLAMSHGSRLILERLGIWPQVEPATPIESIHVSQRGGFGRTVLSAQEAGVPALGYVVRYAALQRAFGKALESERVSLIAGAEVTGMESIADGVVVEYCRQETSNSIAARLLVIADGGASMGSHAGAMVKVREYGQDAVVGLVETSQPHGRKAYERFTPDGPIALLPFENRYALVWTATPETADQLAALPAAAFLEKLQQHFGDRAGRFVSLQARARFPLSLRYAEDPVLTRVVMLGNAAQALHPIAGQGFNLGLRDAWELGEVLLRQGTPDPGREECLSGYRAMRRPDRLRGIALTHSLVKIFSNDVMPLRVARGAALSLLELVPPVKRAFMQRMIFGAPR
jgi:2-octaprenyl-6-methoxyphenol hydroxylase